MQLKPVQKASKGTRFCDFRGKKIEPHYFVVVRPQSNQNEQ